MKINRRSALGLVGAAAYGATVRNANAKSREPAAFLHGIASGDPLQDRIILWTRATPEKPDATSISVDWEVSEDADFNHIVQRGEYHTTNARDFTVKVDVTGLRPNTEYRYRFRCGEQVSPVGITRTLPSGSVSEMVLAVASCSLYSTGYFNAYRDIAELKRVDMVIHLGDYIYEYGGAPDQLGMSIGQKIGRAPTPAHEARNLADYRERYACYKLDVDLQAAHARAPWICVWDDHETANDAWSGGAQNHQAEEGVWTERRDAAVRAFYEWIPIREPEPDTPLIAINRTFELGDLATLIMVENRFIGRDRQIDMRNPEDVTWNAVDLSTPDNPTIVTDPVLKREILSAFSQGRPVPAPYDVRVDPDSIRRSISRPERSVYGQAQEGWIRDRLEKSVQAGKPWQIIGNQMVMAHTTGADIVGFMGEERWAKAMKHATPILRPWLKQLETLPVDVPFEFDGWNAYPAARERMDKIFSDTKSHPLVLSGDSHVFWVNELFGEGDQRVAAELGVTAITSSSIGNMLGNVELGAAFSEACPEVLFCQHLTKGYGLVTLKADEARIDLIGMTNVHSRDYERFVLKSYHVRPDPSGGVGPLEEIQA